MTKKQNPSQRRPVSTANALVPKFSLLLAAIALGAPVHAMDLDPNGVFTLNFFAQDQYQYTNNYCGNCQAIPSANKNEIWGDALLPGTPYGGAGETTWQIQPWIGFHQSLGNGFKLDAVISQNYRNGGEDVPGFWREKDVAISHEDYGRLAYGDMMTRSWQISNDTYGSNLGVDNQWTATGAGYGMLTNALRYTTRPLDVAEGNLVLEATYSGGNSGFTVNKPEFWELYAQFYKGPLVVDAIYQDTRNGGPSSWGQNPFTGLYYDTSVDNKLGGSGQSLVELLARYRVDAQWEVSGGVRANRWSGAYAVEVSPAYGGQWNNMFNVNWGGTLNGVANPGYPVTSMDALLGLRYFTGPWTASWGVVYLGQGQTDNPLERGQGNSALVNNVQLMYDFKNGFQVYGYAGLVNYSHLGLSPISCPDNSCGSDVDSRVVQNGNWIGMGAQYEF